MEKLPTIKELMSRLDEQYVSVSYGDSRTIQNYLNTNVLGYGIGFCGFILIFKTKLKLLKAYSYGQRHPLTNYTQSGFSEIGVEKAINQIKTGSLFVEKAIDEDELSKGKLEISDYERPILGGFKIRQKYGEDKKELEANQFSDVCEYRIVRLKSKKLRGEYRYKDGEKWSGVSLKELTEKYEMPVDKMTQETNYWKRFTMVQKLNITLSKEIVEEAKSQILVNEI